jgi:hypothetical protein
VPPELERRITAALADTRANGASLAEDLQAAAERLLATAKQGGADRGTALTLLAADALVTYACEWTAEFEPQRLGEME